jgi:hypothetical protein
MRPVLKEFHQALDAVWLTMSQSRSATAPRSVVALNLTLCLMRGMGFQTILRSDPQYYQEMLALWKEILPAILEDGPPADGPLPD